MSPSWLGNVFWSKRDSSIYIKPYGTVSEAFAGVHRGPQEGESLDIDFTKQLRGKEARLSIHESGQVHAYCDKERTIGIQTPPLFRSHRRHLATIGVWSHSGLPEVAQLNVGSHPDVVLQEGAEYLPLVWIVLFCGMDEYDLPDHKLKLRMDRVSLSGRPIFFAWRVRGEDKTGEMPVSS